MDSPKKKVFRRATLSREASETASRTIVEISDIETEQEILIGKLSAANLRTGSFEIDLGDEGTISGKVDPERPNMLRGMKLGNELKVTILEKTETVLATGEKNISYQLINASAPDPLPPIKSF